MSIPNQNYCVVCGDDREFRHEHRPTEFEVRGRTLVFDVPVKICEHCGTVEYEERVDPAKIAFQQYRKNRGLLTPEEIRAIRKGYRLSQKSFAALLGMSEATINRYEGGGLQDEAHDQAIRACRDLQTIRELLDRRGSRISPWQRHRAWEAVESQPSGGKLGRSESVSDFHGEVSARTGYRRFDYLRYAAVVVWLCRRLPLVTSTSLNKLLFFVDFLHFKSEAVSLTGLAYRRLQYGPAPKDYGRLQDNMETDGFVEVREEEWASGNTGIVFRPGARADELHVEFTRRELRVLEQIAGEFQRSTPRQMCDRSHQEAAWRDTDDKDLISYDKAATLSIPVPV